MEKVFGNIKKAGLRDYAVKKGFDLEECAIIDLALKSKVLVHIYADECYDPHEEYEVYTHDIDYYIRHFPQIDREKITQIIIDLFRLEEYYYIDLGAVKGYVVRDLEEDEE